MRPQSKSIIWLASYPKSGNTWLRVFLANYIFDTGKPVPINQVHRLGIGDSIAKAYAMVAKGPYDPTDLKLNLGLRYKMLRGIVANKADVNFVKTHNEKGAAFGVELIPKQYSRSAIYILRNPLDMIISFSSHYGVSIDQTIESIGRRDHVLPGGKSNTHQFLGSWSAHVLNWTRTREFPVLALRYEDMQSDPHTTFSKAVSHIGLPVDADKLDRAIRFSSFDALRKQEDAGGFIENSENQDRFFRSGQSGQWEGALTDDQIDRVRSDHRRVMKQFGYL